MKARSSVYAVISLKNQDSETRVNDCYLLGIFKNHIDIRNLANPPRLTCGILGIRGISEPKSKNAFILPSRLAQLGTNVFHGSVVFQLISLCSYLRDGSTRNLFPQIR